MKKRKTDLVILILITCYLVIPILMTFLYSISTNWNGILPEGFTLQYYAQLFLDMAFWQSLGRSLLVTVVPIVFTTIAVLLLMYVITVHCPRLEKYAQILCTIPYSVQGVILAVSVLSIYSNAPLLLSNTFFMLTGTYCVVVLPYMYQGIKNNLDAINSKQLLEAAQLLGASKFMAFFRVIVPNIFSGIIISALLSSSFIFGDFVIVNLIGGNYFKTAQIYLFTAMKTTGHLASAIVIVLFLITLLIAAVAHRAKRKS